MTAHAISSTAADWPLKPERCRASISVVGDTARIDFPSRGWRSGEALFLLIAGPALASLFVAAGIAAVTTASTRKDFASSIFLIAFGLLACVIALREARRLAITTARVTITPDRLSLFERTLGGDRREDLPRGDVT